MLSAQLGHEVAFTSVGSAPCVVATINQRGGPGILNSGISGIAA